MICLLGLIGQDELSRGRLEFISSKKHTIISINVCEKHYNANNAYKSWLMIHN